MPVAPGLATGGHVSAAGSVEPHNEVDPIEALRQCSERQSKCGTAITRASDVKRLQIDMEELEEDLRDCDEEDDCQEDSAKRMRFVRRIELAEAKITEAKKVLRVAIQECHADILEFSPAMCTPSIYEDTLKTQDKLKLLSVELLSEDQPPPKEPTTGLAPQPTPPSINEEVSVVGPVEPHNEVSGVGTLEATRQQAAL